MSAVRFNRRGDMYAVTFAYNRDVVELLKVSVPFTARKWVPARREWQIEDVYAAAGGHWPVTVRRLIEDDMAREQAEREAGLKTLPPAPAGIVADTRSWREDSDPILGFIGDRLVYDHDTHVPTTDLLGAFNDWLKARGHQAWSDQTLAGRLKGHEAWNGIGYRQTLAGNPGLSRATWTDSNIPKRYRAWHGVRFRTPGDVYDDDDDETERAGGTGQPTVKPQHARGAQHAPDLSRGLQTFLAPECPVQPVHDGSSGALFEPPHTNGQVRYCGCGNTLEAPEARGSGKCRPCRDKQFAGYDR